MEQLLTVQDLMHRWQCSYPAAYKAMRSKIIRATKPKKRLLAKLKDVERYEEAYRVSG